MKKFLTVLCLALLLALVCTSAMAAVNPQYTVGGKKLSDYEKENASYGGNYIRSVEVLIAPNCYSTGSARINTWLTQDNTIVLDDSNNKVEGPSSVITIDVMHTYTNNGNDGWVNLETSANNCTSIKQKRVCTVCGHTETREQATAGTHIFVVKPVEGKGATCQSSGWAQSICRVCGAIDPSNPNPFETGRVDHEFSVLVVDKAETCKEVGKGHYTCKWCGTPELGIDGKTKYIEIPAHDPVPASNPVIEEEATCFKPGKSHDICAKCGERIHGSEKPIEKLEHQFGNWVVKTPATCVDGLEERMCALCGTVETQIVKAEDADGKNDRHTWTYYYKASDNVNGVSVCQRYNDGTAAPSQQNYYRRCTVCGKEELVEAGKASYSNHQFVPDTSKAHLNEQPECIGGKDGIEYLRCTACGGTYARAIPALTAHNWGSWVCVVAPGTDGTENGRWERTCTNYHCIEKQTYVGKTAPDGSSSTPTTAPTTAPSTQPGVTANYKFTSWNFNGSGVSGQVAGNVSYRTPGLSVNVIIYTPTGTFLAVSSPVDENGQFSVSAGGAVYAVSIQLKDNTKTYAVDGKYV